MREFEYEPIPGLPELPPTGEHILWQGAPSWKALARRAFHVRTVALYFLLLIAWFMASDLADGRALMATLGRSLWLGVLCALAISVLMLLAWAMARATVYTITNQRVVMRFGVAIQIMINIPFREISSAAVKLQRDGTGDIPLALTESRVSYLVLWPHVRPWHFSPPEPMLRAVADAGEVARILGDALKAVGAQGGASAARPTDPDEMTQEAVSDKAVLGSV